VAFNPGQRRIADILLAEAQRQGASPRETKALLEAGIVESSLRNLNHGDRDSLGVLQQRPSQGWQHALSPTLAARDFLTAARRANHGFSGSAGQLAQTVQRSAFPGRYDQHGSEAEALLGHAGSGRTATAAAAPAGWDTSGSSVDLASVLAAAQPRPAAQSAGVQSPSFSAHPALPGRYQQPVSGGVAQPSSGVADALQSIVGAGGTDLAGGSTAGPATGQAVQQASPKSTARALVSEAAARANEINAKHLPYLWGGGHGGRVNAKTTGPLDCSGAVSAVLGIDPRVSSQFEHFGSAGRAPGGKGITIYANKTHVLMEINGHFFGTSHANPGGGAGWIPRSQISGSYLQNFTARHLAGSVG
jgi:hypothetical protein